jgi:membrane dipeptidase
MFVFDGHADTAIFICDEGRDIGARGGRGHLDLERMREAGWLAQWFALFPHPRFCAQGGAIRRVLELADAIAQTAARLPDRMALCTTADEVLRAVESGRIAAMRSIEGGHAIENSLAVLRQYHALGVRAMTLTWNNSTDWADACMEQPRAGGLTEFGVAVVREMERLGMLVDVSHVHEETFWAVLRVVRRPVIASHSSCRALCDHPRNLRDEQLRAIAGTGGIVCINFYSMFVSEEFRRAAAAAGADEDVLAAMPRPPFECLLDHLDHAIRVAGADHVGVGADFDGVSSLPDGVDDCRAWPRIAEGLRRRGHSDTVIAKVAGANMLRVVRKVCG